MLIDSHVNLHAKQFEGDVDDVIQAARASGVVGMLTIADRLDNMPAIEKISKEHSFIWHSVGVHPHYAKDFPTLSDDTLIDYLKNPRAIGVGECGLDYYYEFSDRSAQENVFRAHIHAAQKTGLPLIIHTRDADADMERLLREEIAQKPFIPLMHCYTSGMELAKTALDLGGYVSMSGIVTFKNAEAVRDVAKMVPLDRLIIETDCPYLAPVPMRGRRCEPAHLPHIADYMAALRGMSRSAFEDQTTGNFFRLFAKANPHDLDGGS